VIWRAEIYGSVEALNDISGTICSQKLG
jgi:hypothetical protein